MRLQPITPEQAKRIRYLMATRRRQRNWDGRYADSFPQWHEGMSTLSYVREWERRMHFVKTT